MSSDDTVYTEELVYSPKNSIAPRQLEFGNCLLISSTKVILRNIIVVLLNSLKSTPFSEEEQKFIKESLNYNECNEYINTILDSEFIHSCLQFDCTYEHIILTLEDINSLTYIPKA
jgi:hypothetical protein